MIIIKNINTPNTTNNQTAPSRLQLLITASQSGDRQALLLPALALAIPMSAKYIRHIRSNILEEINRDYVAGALVRGIPKATVFRRFILRSLGSTLITLFSLSAGSLLGGTAIIEMIFMIDGIGRMAMDAVLMRDYPVVQAYVVWTALIFTCVNLVTDLLLHHLEPQAQQFTKGGGYG